MGGFRKKNDVEDLNMILESPPKTNMGALTWFRNTGGLFEKKSWRRGYGRYFGNNVGLSAKNDMEDLNTMSETLGAFRKKPSTKTSPWFREVHKSFHKEADVKLPARDDLFAC